MIAKLIQLSLNRPRLIISLFLILLTCSAISLPFLTQVSDISQLISKQDQVIKFNKEMEKVFGSTRSSLITLNDAFSVPKLAEIKRIQSLLLKKDKITDVISVYSEKLLTSEGGSFEVTDILKATPKNKNDIQKLKQRLNSYSLYDYSIFHGSNINILVQFDSDVNDEYMSSVVKSVLDTSELKEKFITSGWSEINNSIKGTMDSDLYVLVPLVFIIITIIFFYFFRSWRGILIPLATIILAIASAIGFMSLFGISLNVVSNSIPVLLVAIGTSDGIHFLTKYYYYAPEYRENHRDLISKSSNIIAPTILLTSLTTMAGFLANLFSPVESISQFGLITAVGVFIAGIASFLLIPSLLTKFDLPIRLKNEGGYQKVFSILSNSLFHLIKKQRFLVFFSLVLLTLASLYTAMELKSNYTLLGYFNPKAPVVKNAQAVSKSFGGLIEFNLVIDTKRESGLIDSNILSAFETVVTKYKKKYSKDLVFVASLSDYIKNMSRAYNGDEKYYRIPQTNDEIAQYLEVYSWSGEVEEDLKYVTDPTYQIGRIYGRFKLQENSAGDAIERNLRYYEKIVNEMSYDLQKEISTDVDIRLYGELPMWITTLKNIVQGQIHSILVAIVIVFLITFPILKSIKLTLIALIPIIIAISFNFAFMRIFNIQLDIATSLVSAMAIGIGIDDALHFLLTFKRIHLQTSNLETALKETMQLTSKAIFATSLTLTIGYSVFFFSSFKPINYFGLLNILTILFATLATMIAIPAAILIFAPKQTDKR